MIIQNGTRVCCTTYFGGKPIQSITLMYRYTACKAFRQLLQELGDFAGQREVVAENLQSNVVREVHLLAKELREERKVLTIVDII